MEVLLKIFMILLIVTGSIILIEILINITIINFIEAKRKKKALNELKELAEKCMKDVVEAEKIKKEATKKAKTTKKKEEI